VGEGGIFNRDKEAFFWAFSNLGRCGVDRVSTVPGEESPEGTGTAQKRKEPATTEKRSAVSMLRIAVATRRRRSLHLLEKILPI